MRSQRCNPTFERSTGSPEAGSWSTRLLDANVTLRQIRIALSYLRKESGGKLLTDVTLMSDGRRCYACRSGEEILDVLSHGQAVSAIAIGRVWADTAGDVADLAIQNGGID